MTEDRTVLPLGQHSEIALMRSLTVADAAFTTLWVSVVAGWILITAPFGHAVFTVSILCAGGVIVTMLWRAAWLLTRALSLSGGPDVPPEVAGEVTATVRRDPAPGWLRFRASAPVVGERFFEEDHLLVDETGRVVAGSRQLAMVPVVNP